MKITRAEAARVAAFTAAYTAVMLLPDVILRWAHHRQTVETIETAARTERRILSMLRHPAGKAQPAEAVREWGAIGHDGSKAPGWSVTNGHANGGKPYQPPCTRPEGHNGLCEWSLRWVTPVADKKHCDSPHCPWPRPGQPPGRPIPPPVQPEMVLDNQTADVIARIVEARWLTHG